MKYLRCIFPRNAFSGTGRASRGAALARWAGVAAVGASLSLSGMARADDKAGTSNVVLNQWGGNWNVSLNLNGWITPLGLSVTARVLDTAVTDLGAGQCSFTGAGIKSGSCTWANPKFIGDGVHDIEFRVKRDGGALLGDPIVHRFTRTSAVTGMGISSVFGVPVSGQAQILALILQRRYSPPNQRLDGPLQQAFLLSPGLAAARDRVLPPGTMVQGYDARAKAEARVQAVIDAKMPALTGRLVIEQVRAENTLREGWARDYTAALTAYNSTSGNARLAAVNELESAIRDDLARSAAEWAANLTLMAEPKKRIEPAEVVASLIAQDDPSPPGGFCGTFLVKLCEQVPSLVTGMVATRAYEWSQLRIDAAEKRIEVSFPARQQPAPGPAGAAARKTNPTGPRDVIRR